MIMAKQTSTVLIALLTGVALGAAAGILFAPDKGSKTRGKIRDGYDSGKKAVSDKYDQLYEKLKSKFNGTPKEFAEAFENLLTKAEYRKEEVIDALENKLRDLKKTVAASKN